MNITLRVFGLELVSLTASTEDTAEEYDGSGTTASTFGFTAEMGDDVGLPARWGDE